MPMPTATRFPSEAEVAAFCAGWHDCRTTLATLLTVSLRIASGNNLPDVEAIVALLIRSLDALDIKEQTARALARYRGEAPR